MGLGKTSLAALTALSMVATPAMAQAASAAKLSVASQARSGAELGEASELRGGFIIPLIAIIAIILGILAATQGDGDPPRSP
jgi:hypothetical protein